MFSYRDVGKDALNVRPGLGVRWYAVETSNRARTCVVRSQREAYVAVVAGEQFREVACSGIDLAAHVMYREAAVFVRDIGKRLHHSDGAGRTQNI